MLIRIFFDQIRLLKKDNFKNRELYDKVMAALIEKGFTTSREIVQKKWINMLDTYRRIKHRNSVSKLNGSAAEYKTNWDFFNVSFLIAVFEFHYS